MTTDRVVWVVIFLLGFVAIATVPAADQPSAAQSQWESLALRYEEAQNRYFAATDEAKNDEELAKAYESLAPENILLGDLFSFEERWRGSDEGLAAVCRIIMAAAAVGNMDLPISKAREKSADILLAHYLNHPQLDAAMRKWDWGATSPRAEAFLRGARLSRHVAARARATLCLARHLGCKSSELAATPALRALSAEIEDANSPTPFDTYEAEMARIGFTQETVREKQNEALRLLDELETEYSKVYQRNWGQTKTMMPKVIDETSNVDRRTYGQLAASLRFELTSLQTGREVPEIDSPDAFGNPLRLGGFRGKVVVLMFSADWCGACEDMYPQLREMLAAYGPNRLAVLTVMADDTVDTVRAAVKEGKINWPVWWDGKKQPTIFRWNVTSWPTIYVLDDKGVIRFRDVRGPYLAAAVKTLAKEFPREEPR